MDEGAVSVRGVLRTAEGSHPLRLVAGFTVAAGVIHAVAMVEHFGEHPVYGVFFAVVAVWQLAWGTMVYRRPEARRSLTAAAIANLAVVAIWAVSRTTGLPLGPEAGRPEVPGVIDILATLDEVAIVALVIGILQPAGRVGRRLAGLTPEQESRIGSALLAATVFGLMLGGHTH